MLNNKKISACLKILVCSFTMVVVGHAYYGYCLPVQQEVAMVFEQRRIITDKMFDAIERGDLAALKFYLQQFGADVSAQQYFFGDTLLISAVKQENVPLVQLLLEYGAPADQRGGHNRGTALHYAVQVDNVVIARMLLNKGAGIYTKDINRMSPIQLAVVRASKGCFSMFLRHVVGKMGGSEITTKDKGDVFNHIRDGINISPDTEVDE